MSLAGKYNCRWPKYGNVYYYPGSGSSFPDSGIDYTWDAWNHVTLVADMANQTFDVTVGANTATGLPWTADRNLVGSITFALQGAYENVYVDNIQISVLPPPPAGTIMVIK